MKRIIDELKFDSINSVIPILFAWLVCGFIVSADTYYMQQDTRPFLFAFSMLFALLGFIIANSTNSVSNQPYESQEITEQGKQVAGDSFITLFITIPVASLSIGLPLVAVLSVIFPQIAQV